MAPEDNRLKRRRAERRGRFAEHAAALFLRLKGYQILIVRYRAPGGEVDIIARRGDLVAFVEVKMRKSEREALDSVGYATQQRIRAASHHWIARQPDAQILTYRYDIVAVQRWKLPRHVVDAF